MNRFERVTVIVVSVAAVANGLSHEAPVRHAAADVLHVAVISISTTVAAVTITVFTLVIAWRKRAHQRRQTPVASLSHLSRPVHPPCPARSPGRPLTPGQPHRPAAMPASVVPEREEQPR